MDYDNEHLGCYFCCLFWFNFTFFFLLPPGEVRLYYFFLKKILNVFQKIWQDNRADTRYIFFCSFVKRFQKCKPTTKKKSFKDMQGLSLFLNKGKRRTREKKKNWRLITVEHTASTILVVLTETIWFKERTFYSILELWSFTTRMDFRGWSFTLFLFIFYFYFFSFFLFPVMGWALQVCFCHRDIDWWRFENTHRIPIRH